MQTQSSFKTTGKGTLFLVPTPIGNLGDMTYRAIDTLKSVALIAAEDTRNTQKLLNHFEIETKQISFHEHNTQQRIETLIEKLEAGDDIAQVSDAGMPSISDPGHELVKACIIADIAVVPLPGANAGITALIASGITPQPFTFYGFLPRKGKELNESVTLLAQKPETIIFYEAPHRLKKTLQVLMTAFGPERQVTLGRELTKKFEEFIRGSLKEVLAWTSATELRGEFVIIVAGNPTPIMKISEKTVAALPLPEQVEAQIQQGANPNVAIKTVAKANGLKKQVVYNAYHELTE
ncbi:16S rRNA (cytidine(1402)-2'-O)-methyltransferase [Latilactobacillus graminis]|uniref:Ribosomal RNA small subunit methyltransferase I n=2 Tax=Latilactobacillus graminis TaxID=60519 RepID=A0AA89I2T7_9LACO|nr:16S rRNA (cytidine(1402)-2'-O)-methyltransferase [Latilactobacillus graminis]KRM24538.1 ribosomal RNA small subunit methyltransferase I [Latilactobacillus graminis DSM 20719]QFP79008.1 16S rRNA (cytidine(1402)-2'-O)-methyltransferase [Latilactobacillus graminis]